MPGYMLARLENIWAVAYCQEKETYSGWKV
jgi:hypothetical protein